MSFSFGNIKQYSLSRKRTKDHNVPSCPFLFVLLYGAQLSTQIKVKTDNEGIRPAFNSGFCRMKRLQVFLQSTPLGCDASKSQGYKQYYIRRYLDRDETTGLRILAIYKLFSCSPDVAYSAL